MAMVIRDADNVRESFSSAGATVVLGGAMQNSRAFSAVLANGDTAWVVARKGGEFSIGRFTYTSGSLAQTEVYYSSNSNAAVTFSPGTDGEAYIVFPSRSAELLFYSAYASSVISFGANQATNPVLQLNFAAGSVATGWKMAGAAAAGRAALAVISSGTDEGGDIDAKGAGTIRLNNTATGNVITPRVLQVTNATASTSTSTGALLVTGGAGIAGDLNWGGAASSTSTPSVSATTGSITTASCTVYWKRFGKFVLFQAIVAITTNGTGAGTVKVSSMPFTPLRLVACAGREMNISGATLTGFIDGVPDMYIVKYDNTYPGASGASLNVSGIVETA